MKQSPTAYSNIFWHFTGAPKFKEKAKINKPGDMINSEFIKKEKTNEEAFNILKKILGDKKLLATSVEEVIEDIEAKSFCCVCDLPLQDLTTHSKYYGNVAIGFSSDSIYKNFNPVFYINIEKLEILSEICNKNNNIFKDKSNRTSSISKPNLSSLKFKNYIKITNFNEATNETFYREKEWRCLENYNFKPVDVSALIVPKIFVSEIENYLIKKDYKNVSIISWEFIKKS
ncbi:MAG: abortive infection system antitoxin AbiGi family protein [archaeon]